MKSWDRFKQQAEQQQIIHNDRSDGSKLDVAAYLAAHGTELLKESKGPGGSTLYCLRQCIFDPNHQPNEAAIGQQSDGKLFYQCFHDSCSGRTWQEARQIISGAEKLTPWMIGGNGHKRSMAFSPVHQHSAGPGYEETGTKGESAVIKPSFEFIHNAVILANLKPIEWRIKDIMVENSFYYDFGDPGSFKTFVALDRMLCIAAGIGYHGHPVKQGTVFFVAGEGQQGIGRRIAAWHIAHKTKAADVPFFLAKTPTQLMDPGAVDDVRQAVDAMAKEYGPPAVLHIDTLSRNFGEGDENATKDMNRVIQNMDIAFGNDFCRGITHHTGHTNKDRARGSIALHGAADTAYRVAFTDNQQVFVECKKMKDARSAPAMLFDLNEIKLIIEGQKDQSYTLTLSSEGEEAAHAATDFSNTCKLSSKMSRCLEILDGMYRDYEKKLATDGRDNTIPRVDVKDWRESCLDRKIYKRGDNFNRALESMKDRKLIHLDDNNRFVYSVSIYAKYFEKECI